MMIGSQKHDDWDSNSRYLPICGHPNHLADPIVLVALEPRVWLARSNAGKNLHANRGNVSTLVEAACRDHLKSLPSSTATSAEFALVDAQTIVELTGIRFRRFLAPNLNACGKQERAGRCREIHSACPLRHGMGIGIERAH